MRKSKKGKVKVPDFKVLTLGDSSVGKTSFIVKFIDNNFTLNYIATVGLDYKHKEITLKSGKKIGLRIFDTAGQERFRAISYNFIKNANGIILIYDISNKETFLSVKGWIESIQNIADEKISIVLCGNKCDLEEKREVTKLEGEEKANEFNIPFFETSCKEGININETFEKISELIVNNNKNNIENESQKLTKDKANQGNSGCC